MSLAWKPEVWAKMARETPVAFFKELASQRPPTANLFTTTYLQCVIQGFRALSIHKNTQYEAQFFIEMLTRLPHADAQKPHKFDLDFIKNMTIDRAPIECLLWNDALMQRLNPKATIDFFTWILQLRMPTYDPENHYSNVSLKNSPEWASAYINIQRGASSSKLRNWMSTASVDKCLGVVNAIGFLHAKEKPAWLSNALNAVLSRVDDAHANGRIFDITTALHYAWQCPTPELDATIVRFILAKPDAMSFLARGWFGNWGEHKPEIHEWWSRQTPACRGSMLADWLGNSSSWTSLFGEVLDTHTPLTALDVFTKYPVELTSALAHKIVLAAPLEKETIRACLARIIPAIYVAELAVSPEVCKSYLLSMWDTLNKKELVLSIDGLLDLEP